jgi:HEAT repeat protein
MRITLVIVATSCLIFTLALSNLFAEEPAPPPEEAGGAAAPGCEEPAKPEEPAPPAEDAKPAEKPAPPVEPTAEEKAKIDELIKQLGDEDLAKREAAEKTLTDMGDEIIPQVATAKAKDPDAEIRERCDHILFKKKWHISHALWQKLGDIRPLFENPKKYNNDREFLAEKLAVIDNDDTLAFAVCLLQAALDDKLSVSTVKLAKYLGRHGAEAFEMMMQCGYWDHVDWIVHTGMNVQDDLDLCTAIAKHACDPNLSTDDRRRLLDLFRDIPAKKELVPAYLQMMLTDIIEVQYAGHGNILNLFYYDAGYDAKTAPEVRKAAIEEISKWWEENKDKTEQEWIRHGARCDVNSPDARQIALKRLVETKDPSVNAELHKFLDGKSGVSRWVVAQTLYDLDDDVGVSMCLDALKRRDNEELNGLAWARRLLDDDALRDAIVEAFKDEKLDDRVRSALIFHLPLDKVSLLKPQFKSILGNEQHDETLRSAAFYKLASVDKEEAEKYALTIALTKSDPLRTAAAVHLAMSGKAAYFPVLLEYLNSDDRFVRYEICHAVLRTLDPLLHDFDSLDFFKNEKTYIERAKQLMEDAEEKQKADSPDGN